LSGKIVTDAKPRVLVVEDERFFREAITEVLSAHDYSCVVCEDGEGALKRVDSERFAVVVLDIRLPGIDGIEVLRQIRIVQPELRVIMLSASTDQELVLEALRLGASDYLAKPLHDEELMLAVHRAADGYRVASDFRSLQNRLNELVDSMEEISKDANDAPPNERLPIIQDAVVRVVSVALRAEKTSFLSLNEDQSRLDVVAALGRDLAPDQMDSVKLGEGIAGRALADSTPLVVTDIRAESQFAADLAPDCYSTESFAVAPIEVPGRKFGVLCATDRKGGAQFGPEDLSLLRLISAQVAGLLAGTGQAGAGDVGSDSGDAAEANGLAEPRPSHWDGENSATDATMMMSAGMMRDAIGAEELFADASSAQADLDAELARTICDAVVNEIEPASLLREALRAVEVALDADPVSLYLLDPESGELVMESTGKRGLRVDHDRLPLDRGLTGGVFQRGQLIAAPDPESDPRFDLAVDTPSDKVAGSLLCVPLRLRGKIVGVCRVHRAQGATVSARTGEVLIAALSAAVRNVLLYRSLLDSIEEVAAARRAARG
jgi:CheY-like chemotaxis protein